MAGVIWGGVDLESTYGFKVQEFVPGPAEVEMIVQQVPGRDGVIVLGVRKKERPNIKLSGYVTDSTYANVYAKIKNMDMNFLGVLSAHPSATYVSQSVSAKNLEIPGETEKYPNCYCVSFKYEPSPKRMLSKIGYLEIFFFQSAPEKTA